MKGLVVIGVFIIAIIAGAALFANPNSSSHSETPAQNTGSTIGYAAQNPENPIANLDLQRLEGGTIKLADLAGEKAVMLDFWASWCHNCRRDMPIMQTFYEKYKEDVEVVAINLQENKNTIQRFVDSEGFTFPIVLDPTGGLSQAFQIRFTNTHILINKQGEVVKIIPGDVSEQDFISLI